MDSPTEKDLSGGRPFSAESECFSSGSWKPLGTSPGSVMRRCA